jgi:hypothetical protein
MRDASNTTAADTNGLPKDMASLMDTEKTFRNGI